MCLSSAPVDMQNVFTDTWPDSIVVKQSLILNDQILKKANLQNTFYVCYMSHMCYFICKEHWYYIYHTLCLMSYSSFVYARGINFFWVGTSSSQLALLNLEMFYCIPIACLAWELLFMQGKLLNYKQTFSETKLLRDNNTKVVCCCLICELIMFVYVVFFIWLLIIG